MQKLTRNGESESEISSQQESKIKQLRRSIKCKYGKECKYFKQNNCRYDHTETQKSTPSVNKNDSKFKNHLIDKDLQKTKLEKKYQEYQKKDQTYKKIAQKLYKAVGRFKSEVKLKKISGNQLFALAKKTFNTFVYQEYDKYIGYLYCFPQNYQVDAIILLTIVCSVVKVGYYIFDLMKQLFDKTIDKLFKLLQENKKELINIWDTIIQLKQKFFG